MRKQPIPTGFIKKNSLLAPQAAYIEKLTDIHKLEALEYEDVEKLYLQEYNVTRLEDLSEAVLLDLDDVGALIEARKREYGILYYKPYESRLFPGTYPQDEFHKSERKIRMICSGNQAGKTQAGAAEILRIALGIDPYKKVPCPNKGRIIATDLDKGVMEVVWPKIEALLPKAELAIEPRKYSGGQIKKLQFMNGSSIEFLSYEQEEKLFEGWTGDWVWFDEPPPRAIYTACFRGLMRRQGRLMFTMTPLSEPWIYDEIYLKAGDKPDQPAVFTLPMKGNPYLSLEEIAAFEKSIPDDEREARMEGRFKHLSGLIYKEFSDEHRISSFAIPKDWTRYIAMDYHPRTPCAILWCAVDPKGTLYFYDELWIDSLIFDISEAVVNKCEEHGAKPVLWLIDSLSAAPDRATGRSAMREFRECGMKLDFPTPWRSSLKNWSLGKDAVHEALKIKNGFPGAYFFEDKVPRCIEGFTHYIWDEFTGSREMSLKEKPKKAYAHFPDAARYIMVMKPSYRRLMPDDRYAEQVVESMAITGYRNG